MVCSPTVNYSHLLDRQLILPFAGITLFVDLPTLHIIMVGIGESSSFHQIIHSNHPAFVCPLLLAGSRQIQGYALLWATFIPALGTPVGLLPPFSMASSASWWRTRQPPEVLKPRMLKRGFTLHGHKSSTWAVQNFEVCNYRVGHLDYHRFLIDSHIFSV
jgi:hypothetical protein